MLGTATLIVSFLPSSSQVYLPVSLSFFEGEILSNSGFVSRTLFGKVFLSGIVK